MTVTVIGTYSGNTGYYGTSSYVVADLTTSNQLDYECIYAEDIFNACSQYPPSSGNILALSISASVVLINENILANASLFNLCNNGSKLGSYSFSLQRYFHEPQFVYYYKQNLGQVACAYPTVSPTGSIGTLNPIIIPSFSSADFIADSVTLRLGGCDISGSLLNLIWYADPILDTEGTGTGILNIPGFEY